MVIFHSYASLPEGISHELSTRHLHKIIVPFGSLRWLQKITLFNLLKMIFNFPNGNPLLGESIGTSSDFLIFFGGSLCNSSRNKDMK